MAIRKRKLIEKEKKNDKKGRSSRSLVSVTLCFAINVFQCFKFREKFPATLSGARPIPTLMMQPGDQSTKGFTQGIISKNI